MPDVTIVVKARNEAQAALQSVKSDLQQIGQVANGLSGSLKQTGQALQQSGTALTAGITVPVAAIGAAAILSAADFEQALNIMQQVSGATETQMGRLQEQALQLGADTSFSAGEAAAAMLELAKAGMTAEEVSAAIGGTLDLAAASGMNLAQAAEVSANAVNVFGLNAGDANAVANMLAAAANASSVEVTDLAQGMQMAGSVFASSGQSIDDLTTALALMGNAGIKGSDAGTSLKTMMMRLSAPTAEAVDVMRNLGVSVYDVDGNMRELPSVMADLQQALYGTNAVTVSHSNLTGEQANRMEYLQKTISNTQRSIADYQSGIKGVSLDEAARSRKIAELNASMAAARSEYEQLAAVGGTTSTVMRQLTEEQRIQAMTALFGADAIRAANVLLAEGSDGWSEMAASVGEAGAATAVADARMRGMRGAIEYVKGSIDSLLISTVLPFADGISEAVRGVGNAINAFGRLPAPIKNAALAFALAAAAAGPLLVGLGLLASTIGSALPVLAAISGAMAALAGPIGLVLALVAGLAAAWATNFAGIRDATMPAVNAVALAMQRARTSVLAFGSSQTWSSLTQTVTSSFASIGAALAGMWSGDISIPDMAGKVQAEFGKIAGAVRQALESADFGALRDGLAAAFRLDEIDLTGIGERLAALPGRVATALMSVDWVGGFGAAGAAVNGLRDGMLQWVAGAISGIDWKGLSLNVSGLVTGLSGKLRSIDWSGVNPMSIFMPLVGKLVPGLGQAIASVRWVTSSENFSGLVQSISGALSEIDWGTIGTSMNGLANSVRQSIQEMDWGGAGEVAASIQTEIGKLFEGLDLPKIELPQLETAGWGDALRQMGSYLAPAMQRLKESLTGLPAEFAKIKPQFEALGGAAGNLVNAIQPVLQAIGVGLAAAANFGINATAAVLGQLPKMVGAVVGHITSTIDLIAEGIRGATQIVQSLISGDWAGAWQGAQTIVGGFGDFFRDLVKNISTILTGDVATWGKTISGSLQDLGLTAAAEQVSGFVATVEAVGQKIAEVFSAEWTFQIVLPEWMEKLLAWQPPTNWVWPDLPSLSQLKWPALPDLSQLKWPDLPDLSQLKWPSLPDLSQMEWPALPSLSDLKWPALPRLEISMPGWVSGFFGGGGGGPGGRQLGTNYFGGGWTWVGEAGRELVRLPRGAEVIPNRRAEEMAGASSGVSISVGQMVVRDDMDLYSVAYRLNDLLRRR